MAAVAAAVVLYQQEYYDIVFFPRAHSWDSPAEDTQPADPESSGASSSQQTDEQNAQETDPPVSGNISAEDNAEPVLTVQMLTEQGYVLTNSTYDPSSHRIGMVDGVSLPEAYSVRTEEE